MKINKPANRINNEKQNSQKINVTNPLANKAIDKDNNIALVLCFKQTLLNTNTEVMIIVKKYKPLNRYEKNDAVGLFINAKSPAKRLLNSINPKIIPIKADITKLEQSKITTTFFIISP